MHPATPARRCRRSWRSRCAHSCRCSCWGSSQQHRRPHCWSPAARCPYQSPCPGTPPAKVVRQCQTSTGNHQKHMDAQLPQPSPGVVYASPGFDVSPFGARFLAKRHVASNIAPASATSPTSEAHLGPRPRVLGCRATRPKAISLLNFMSSGFALCQV